MRPLYFLPAIVPLLALAALIFAYHSQAQARLQEAVVCWDPDFELPVPCEDDDD